MDKIDPQAFFEAAQRAQSGAAPVIRTSEEHLQPMNFRAAPAVKPEEKPQPEMPEIKPPPPKEADDPLDRGLKGSLIERLAERFKLKPEYMVEDYLVCGDQKVKVHIRKPVYDDFLWTLGVLEQRIESNIDTALMQGQAQQSKFLQHLTACRTVVKIEDEWVWDAFEFRELIKTAVPGWDGETFSPVPGNLVGALAESVHSLFRRLHPDMLFELDRVCREHFPAKTEEEEGDGEGEEAEDENPTPAA